MDQTPEKPTPETEALPAQTPERWPVEFEPVGDQVLLKMDMLKGSKLAIETSNHTVLPSGVVVAVGEGMLMPNGGFRGSKYRPGEHVAVSQDGPWIPLPLVPKDAEEVYITCSEALILGRLKHADKDSPWFKASEDAPKKVARVSGRR